MQVELSENVRHKGSGIMTGLMDKWCFLALGLSQMQFGKFFHAITVSSYMMLLELCQQEDSGSAEDNNHEPEPRLSFILMESLVFCY